MAEQTSPKRSSFEHYQLSSENLRRLHQIIRQAVGQVNLSYRDNEDDSQMERFNRAARDMLSELESFSERAASKEDLTV
jgi:hypothetical protein